MVDYNLINSLGNLDADVDAAVATALGDAATEVTRRREALIQAGG